MTHPADFGRVAVLMGGRTAEREVSLLSGRSVLSTLQAAGVDAVAIDVGNDVIQQLSQQSFDRAMVLLHGPEGEDGAIQGVLEYLNIPYASSGILGCALSMDKLRCKWIWAQQDILTPPYCVVGRGDVRAFIAEVGLPVAVKPTVLGSSIGISKVTSMDQLDDAIAMASRYGEVLVERWIVGTEYAMPMVGDVLLPSVRIEPSRTFYDYQAKYFSGDTKFFCPSGLNAEEELQLANITARACELVAMDAWGRVDYIRCDVTGQFYALELQPVPGMTKTSLTPQAAKQYGWDHETLCLRILSEARLHCCKASEVLTQEAARAEA